MLEYLMLSSFLKHHLGSTGPETADVETLRLEVAELRQKLELATEENRELREKVCLWCIASSIVL